MTPTIRIATRGSRLALWQAEHVAAGIARLHPDIEVTLVPHKTQGDRWLSAPLREVGGKGLFVKELEVAISEGIADIAVHSMKDVPASMSEGFAIPAIAFRADVRDALVTRHGVGLDGLPDGAHIGSSSLRRQSQLLAYRGDLRVSPVRGNVETRIRKMDEGEFDAVVLACAGLDRLGLAERIAERIDVERSVPAAGQGALGVECAADRDDLIALLTALDDPAVSLCVRAERAVSLGLGADCSLPVGAYARLDGDRLELSAVLASADGRRLLRARKSGGDPEALGRAAADELRAAGGDEILAALE